MINDNPSVFKDLKELFPDLSEKTGLTDEQMQVILENMYYLYHNLGLANIDVGNTTTNFTAPGVFSNTELSHREEEVNGTIVDYLDFKFNIPTPKIQTEIITNTVSTPDDVNIDIINYPIIETVNGQSVTTGYKFSFRADLYKGEGLKQNQIISRDTITSPTADAPDFVQDTDGLKYKKKDGDSYSYESVGGNDGNYAELDKENTFTQTQTFTAKMGNNTDSTTAQDGIIVNLDGETGTYPNFITLQKNNSTIASIYYSGSRTILKGDFEFYNLAGTPIIAMYYSNISPLIDNVVSLGTNSKKYKDLYLSGNLTDGTNSISIAEIVNNIGGVSAVLGDTEDLGV